MGHDVVMLDYLALVDLSDRVCLWTYGRMMRRTVMIWSADGNPVDGRRKTGDGEDLDGGR